LSSTGSDRDKLLDHVYSRARRLWWQRRAAPLLGATVVLTALVAIPVMARDSGGEHRLETVADPEEAPTTTIEETTSTTVALISATTTTLAPSPTSTTSPPRPLPPVDLQPDPSRPPRAALRSSAGEVEGTAGSFCWSTQNTDGTGQGVCGDTDALDPDVALPVQRGERVTLRFATDEAPGELLAFVADKDDPATWRAFAIPTQNPSEFVLDLPRGTHRLSFQARWEHGDSTTYFKVEVR
jgi:hypothetical protein